MNGSSRTVTGAVTGILAATTVVLGKGVGFEGTGLGRVTALTFAGVGVHHMSCSSDHKLRHSEGHSVAKLG